MAEVEDEEHQLSVQHKNLPPKSEVTSGKDINTLVDQLIDEEPNLLTRRRHREGLVQLLSRLYQMDAEAEAEQEEEDQDSMQGVAVVLRGLTGAQQVLNGEIASVVKAKGEKQKYEVEVKGQVVKVKGKDHLLTVNTKGSLAAGAYVAIRGLRNHIELNGCIARVAECHEESQRYEVRALDSGQLFRVKKENVVLIEATPQVIAASAAMKENREAMKENRDPNTPRKKEIPEGEDVLEIGSTVELVGLKTAQAYNGQQAEVLSVDRVRGRYEIRLHDGSVKTIRAENVRLVGKSPRKRKEKGG
ncbi:unnamed protein product [Effrenium voratum]|uniref:Uncharacterized protein n=1 Tax=Effrenium voratum TaxID=2562239 RepID=A0AA36IJK5_9DINO|nr:unnamed protein product [Effrenium voratum]